MKRTVVLLAAVLCLFIAACGGGDDDDDGGESASGADTASEETSGFCDVWPSLSDEQNTISDDEAPTPEKIERARELIHSARETAPDEIASEVDEFGAAVNDVLDTVEGGGEISEDSFGELFNLALTVIPKIEDWMVDNCPGYEPQSSFGSDSDTGSSGSAFTADDFADGRLGVPGEDFAALLNDAFPGGHYGYGGGGDETSYDWEITVDMTAEEAVAACESFADALSARDDLTGTLTLHLRSYVAPEPTEDGSIELGGEQGDVLVDNAGISAGDPGECVAA